MDTDPLGAVLGASWAILEASWANLEASWTLLGRLGYHLVQSWPSRRPSQAIFGNICQSRGGPWLAQRAGGHIPAWHAPPRAASRNHRDFLTHWVHAFRQDSSTTCSSIPRRRISAPMTYSLTHSSRTPSGAWAGTQVQHSLHCKEEEEKEREAEGEQQQQQREEGKTKRGTHDISEHICHPTGGELSGLVLFHAPGA